MRLRLILAALFAAVGFSLANAWIHWREWDEAYRDVPEGVPGGWVVRIGFPVLVALTFPLVGALVYAVFARPDRIRIAAAANAAFQAGALVSIVLSREASIFGWEEPVWNAAAEQTVAVEVGALVALAAVLALDAQRRRNPDIGDETVARAVS